MNDTLSTPDPAAQVAEIQTILANRETHSCEAVLIRIGRVVNPPADGDWPELSSSDTPPGNAWERHDDPTL